MPLFATQPSRLRPCILSAMAVAASAMTSSADVVDPQRDREAVVGREFVFADGEAAASCHASTIVEARPGAFVAAWFGGTAEGSPDVGIWVARWVEGRWSRPAEVATGRDEQGRRQPCWNPVLFRLPDGELLLFSKVGPSPRAWWGVVQRSSDDGATWTPPTRLSRAGTAIVGGPVGPVKNKPVIVGDGAILAPSSTEYDGWRVHFERSTDGGKTWDVIGPVTTAAAADRGTVDAIQPSILKLGGGRLLALGRTRNGRIFRVESDDAGLTWGPLTLTDLPNPNAGTDAVTLADGRHLLVSNPTEKSRSPLTVAWSVDARAWTPMAALETGPGEFSYPAVIEASDGLVHVTYTWNRRRIAHVVIDPRPSTAAAVAPRPDAGAGGPPGVVVDHVPARTKTYVGSPSLAILPDGSYVATHDFFGPGSSEWTSGVTDVFASSDRGASWRKIARIDGGFWSNLFVHRDQLYLMGPTRHHGPLVIRRSTDGGRTWTEPTDARTGLLAEGEYHTAPMPVLLHAGRLWRAVEDAGGGREWGKRYAAMMASAAVDADLLDRANWTFSNPLPRDASWLDGMFVGWLEGNAVVSADGRVLDVLRVEAGAIEKAAIVEISADGRRARFDPAGGFINLPGAATKFAIRRDPRSEADGVRPVWWTLSNAVPPTFVGRQKSSRMRNTLVLCRSEDLRVWEPRTVLLHHPDPEKHGFQYVDWLFDGEDIVAVSRTAFDDGDGGAHGFHDANFLTFHRFGRFRDLSMADAVVDVRSLGW